MASYFSRNNGPIRNDEHFRNILSSTRSPPCPPVRSLPRRSVPPQQNAPPFEDAAGLGDADSRSTRAQTTQAGQISDSDSDTITCLSQKADEMPHEPLLGQEEEPETSCDDSEDDDGEKCCGECRVRQEYDAYSFRAKRWWLCGLTCLDKACKIGTFTPGNVPKNFMVNVCVNATIWKDRKNRI